MRPAFVLAANLETLIGVAFVVISLISGLTNYLNSRAKPNGPNRPGGGGGGAAGRPVRPRSERIQSEIEQFMRDQVRRQDGDGAARPRPEKPPVPARQTPQRRPAAPRGPAPRPARKAATPLQPQPMNASGQSSPLVRPGEEFAQRKAIGSPGLGQSLREHVATSMVERVQSGAQSHVGMNVSSEVARHLGTFMGNASASQQPSAIIPGASAHELAAELRSREGLRRALISQIVLERPASLRRR